MVAILHPKHGLVNEMGITISRALWKTQPLTIKGQEFAIHA
jgi:hypothetical protein